MRHADRLRALTDAPTFYAVVDGAGAIVETDTDLDEAYLKAQHHSPTETVAVDGNVYATAPGDERQNPPAPTKGFVQAAVKAAGVPDMGLRWEAFDPFTSADARLVREARARLRARATEIYDAMVDAARGMVHYRQKQGGMARAFRDTWLAQDFLRQNQKMAKVLEGSSVGYDSIGLSLLPHGASFRDPFDTSTDQAAGGRTFCAFSTAECRKVCLVNTGQRALESGAFAASYLYSQLLREMPQDFAINLFDRCCDAFRKAHADGHNRFIRLNVLSDLPWETIAPGFLEAICQRARERILGLRRRWSWKDGLAFYDYTKIPRRPGVANVYDLTLSFSGARNTIPYFLEVLDGAVGCAPRSAVVFVKREETAQRGTGVPYRRAPGRQLSSDQRWHEWTFMGERVFNGDLSDIRPLDPKDARIIGLTYKAASYKVTAPRGSKKKFAFETIVPVEQLDRELPTFLVRVTQPDPDAPPIVMATQDPSNRRLILPTFRD